MGVYSLGGCCSKVQLMSAHNEAKSLHCCVCQLMCVCVCVCVWLCEFVLCLFQFQLVLFVNMAYAQRAFVCCLHMRQLCSNLCTKMGRFHAFNRRRKLEQWNAWCLHGKHFTFCDISIKFRVAFTHRHFAFEFLPSNQKLIEPLPYIC